MRINNRSRRHQGGYTRNWLEKHQQEDTNFFPRFVDCIDDTLMNQPRFKKGEEKKKDEKKREENTIIKKIFMQK